MRRESVRPDINVTPLVDVVLVLLIIFMLIAPQMEAGAAVNLPGVLHPDAERKTQLEPIVLSVTAGGALYLDKVETALDALPAALREAHTQDPSRRLLLKGDRGARWADMRGIFKLAQDVDFPGVALQVGDRRDDATPAKAAE